MPTFPRDVQPYVGANPRIDDPWTRISYETSRDLTAAYYAKPTDADVAITREQVVLNETTAPLLYSTFTPTRMRVKAGAYPKLDKIVDRLAGDAKNLSGRRKVLRMMLWCRDIPVRGRTTKDYLAGGPEELIAFQGGDMCNEMNRVFMVMCQIAGIPSRYVGHFGAFKNDREITWMPGHGVAEVFVEGAWAYVDIRGKYFLWPDGRLASHGDLVRNPDLYVRQSEEVKLAQDLRRSEWNSGQRLVMWPSLQVIANYGPADRAAMTYTPVRQTPAEAKRFERTCTARRDEARAQLRELLRSGCVPPARSPWEG